MTVLDALVGVIAETDVAASATRWRAKLLKKLPKDLGKSKTSSLSHRLPLF
jgi:hypothetical protein